MEYAKEERFRVTAVGACNTALAIANGTLEKERTRIISASTGVLGGATMVEVVLC